MLLLFHSKDGKSVFVFRQIIIWQQSYLLQYALTAIKYVMRDGYDLIFES